MKPARRVVSRGALRLVPITAIAAIVMAGCSTAPPAPKPDANLPAAWAVAARPPGAMNGVDAGKVEWRVYFTDLRLQALIGLALANNRDLRIAAAKVEQDRSQYRIARADRLPTLDAHASLSRTSTPSDLQTGASTQRFDLQGLLSYEIDFWGRVAALSESARASFLATEEARRQVCLTLIADVASAYFSVLEKDELIALAHTTLQLREQSLQIATDGRDIGGADEEERQHALAQLESAKAALAQLDHQRSVAVNQLNFLVGRVADDLPPGNPLAEQKPGVALAAGLPSSVLLNRPDVLAAEQRLAAANADVDAARAAFFPRVMLTTALGFASPALGALFSGGAWSFQPVVSMPLFDGGRTAGNADMARARQVIAVAEYEKTMQIAFREVSDQLSAQVSIAAQLESALAGQRAQANRLKMATGRYQIGYTSYRDVLEAQRGMLTARQITIELRRAAQDAAATLYKVLGGGVDVEPRAVAVAAIPASTSAAIARP